MFQVSTSRLSLLLNNYHKVFFEKVALEILSKFPEKRLPPEVIRKPTVFRGKTYSGNLLRIRRATFSRNRSSCSEEFCEKVLLKIFQIYRKKAMPVSFTGLRPATLFKKRLCHMCFPVNFARLLITLFL